MNPIQRRHAHKLAQKSALVPDISRFSGYEQQRLQLLQHRQQLSEIKSRQDKAQLKTAILPLYDDWLNGVLASKPHPHDVVFTTCMVWHIDAGNLDKGAELGLFALDHAMTMSDQYERNLATVLIDELTAGLRHGAALSLAHIDTIGERLMAKTDHGQHVLNIPDQVRGKFFKQCGLQLSDDHPEQALTYFRLAEQYHAEVHVVGRIKALEKTLSEAAV